VFAEVEFNQFTCAVAIQGAHHIVHII